MAKLEVKFLILKVTVFAVAFAFVEAAVVVYLRHLLGVNFTPPQVDRSEILFLTPGIAFLEPQTAVVMLASVAALAGKLFWEKLAFFFLAFGIWDIFYYIFLRLTIGWPETLTDLDIFFLLPTPWIGPVSVPLAISSLLVVGSLLYIRKAKL